MSATTDSWKADPTLLTYGGGSRSRRNGIFAGVTDIQGMDMYVDPNKFSVKAYDSINFQEAQLERVPNSTETRVAVMKN